VRSEDQQWRQTWPAGAIGRGGGGGRTLAGRLESGSRPSLGCARPATAGVARVGWMFTFAPAAYNLVRMRNIAAVA